MLNIEIKAPLIDRVAVERRLGEMGALLEWTHRQTDTFFRVPFGWLKLREAQGQPAELISYRRSESAAGHNVSEYDVERIGDPAKWMRLLSRVLEVDQVVKKERTLWLYEHTRIHLDRVRGLGEFVELETVVAGISSETAEAETAFVIGSLDLDPQTFLDAPYRDLLPGAD